jgi:hypothetical protein
VTESFSFGDEVKMKYSETMKQRLMNLLWNPDVGWRQPGLASDPEISGQEIYAENCA